MKKRKGRGKNGNFSSPMRVCVCVCVCSVVSDTLRPYGLWPARFLSPWDSLGENTGRRCHFLLQGIFLTQGLNPRPLRLLHCRGTL